MRMRAAAAGVLAGAVILAAACSTSSNDVPTGTWGGRNAGLVVTSVGATASFKCGASGTIGQRLVLADGGTFDVPGSFLSVAVNSGVQPARYTGSVSGGAMTLTVAVNGEPAGTFQLGLGTEPAFDVCNF